MDYRQALLATPPWRHPQPQPVPAQAPAHPPAQGPEPMAVDLGSAFHPSTDQLRALLRQLGVSEQQLLQGDVHPQMLLTLIAQHIIPQLQAQAQASYTRLTNSLVHDNLVSQQLAAQQAATATASALRGTVAREVEQVREGAGAQLPADAPPPRVTRAELLGLPVQAVATTQPPPMPFGPTYVQKDGSSFRMTIRGPPPFSEACIQKRRDPEVFLADYHLAMVGCGKDPVHWFPLYLEGSLRQPWWEKWSGEFKEGKVDGICRSPTWDEIKAAFRKQVGSHLLDRAREARAKLWGPNRIRMVTDLLVYCSQFRLCIIDIGHGAVSQEVLHPGPHPAPCAADGCSPKWGELEDMGGSRGGCQAGSALS